MTITFALNQTVGKIADRSSPSSCDGVDYEFCSVFDECLEFCMENGAFSPGNHGMMSKCRSDGAERYREECLCVDGVAFQRRLVTWREIPARAWWK